MKPGDPVTVAIRRPDDLLCVAHARVDTFYVSNGRRAFYFKDAVIQISSNVTATPHDTVLCGRFDDDEGVAWIRGHQAGDACVALLAAAALDGTGAVPQEPIEDDYSSSEYTVALEHYLEDKHPLYSGLGRR